MICGGGEVRFFFNSYKSFKLPFWAAYNTPILYQINQKFFFSVFIDENYFCKFLRDVWRRRPVAD